MKHIYTFLTLCFLSMIFVSTAFAIDTRNCDYSQSPDATAFLENCGRTTEGINPISSGDDPEEGIKDLIVTVSTQLIALGSLIAVGFIVWAGIQYTTAYGDDEKHKHAKTTGLYALIGLLLMMLSYGFIDIILRFIFEV